MKSFGNDTVTLLVRNITSADELGVAVKTATSIDVAGCSFQPATDTESDTNTDSTISKWRVYCPPTADVLALRATDGIHYRGTTYEIFGDPQIWTDRRGSAHHVTLIVRKARG
ncbi:MAG: hypothetical protein J2P17_29985 [Mycobacterium sp.]|nr:hypothetical protein [Mycobacterium sp.]